MHPPKKMGDMGAAPTSPFFLSSRHLFFTANIVFRRGLKLFLAVLAAEVIGRALMHCALFRRTLVDFHATHRVDSHIVTPWNVGIGLFEAQSQCRFGNSATVARKNSVSPF